jgi:hypothetical protein
MRWCGGRRLELELVGSQSRSQPLLPTGGCGERRAKRREWLGVPAITQYHTC